jgi:secondary thiamine-phosphate synthase enzyme
MVITKNVKVTTRGNGDILDITADVVRQLESAGLQDGVLTLFTPSSTSALTTIEYESGVVHDLQRFFERVAPEGMEYEHHLRWGDANGHSHVRHAFVGPSLSIPFIEGRMTLGTWQQIVLIDFDERPRSRSIVVQIMGE